MYFSLINEYFIEFSKNQENLNSKSILAEQKLDILFMSKFSTAVLDLKMKFPKF